MAPGDPWDPPEEPGTGGPGSAGRASRGDVTGQWYVRVARKRGEGTRRDRKLVRVVLAVLGATLVVVVLADLFWPAPTGSTADRVTVAPAGSNWTLRAGTIGYAGPVSLTYHASWNASGTFTSTAPVVLYVLTNPVFVNWLSVGSGPPTNATWASGNVSGVVPFSAALPAGEYYFVWDNTQISGSLTVVVTTAVVATSTS